METAYTLNQIIAGFEERSPQARDAFGNWEASDSPRRQAGALRVPVVEATATNLPQLAWPPGKSFAVCLSHDVDLVHRYSAKQRMRYVRRMWANGERNPVDIGRAIGTAAGKWLIGQVKKNQRDPYSQFERWLEEEDKLGFRSTFFFFSDVGSRWHQVDEEYVLGDRIYFQGRYQTIADVLRWMHQQGWEIGLHGSWYTSTDPQLMLAQRRRIEEVIDAPVVSNRQHYLHFDPLQTPQVLSQAGFKIDSTLGFNRDVGFRRGTCRPHELIDLQTQRSTGITEVPLVAMDTTLFSTNRLNLSDQGTVSMTTSLLAQAQRYQGCVSINWHPHVADTNRFPGYFNAYVQILDWTKQQGGWGTTLRDAVAWHNQTNVTNVTSATSATKETKESA